MPISSMPMANVLYNIRPFKGVKERVLLSTDGEKKVDLWDKDDDSGRQKWEFLPISPGVYNIKIYAGMRNKNNKFLSCTADGKVVDLYHEDDKSGRQQWRLEQLANGCFYITPNSGLNSNNKFLSCTADGKVVDLYYEDDRSGRQQWQLIPEDIELERIEYDLDKGLIIPTPDFIVTQTVYNDSSLVQQTKVTFQEKATETSTFQNQHSFEFKVSRETSFKVADVIEVGGSLTLELSTQHKWSYGKENSREDTRTYEMPVSVPPKSKVIAKAVISMHKMDVPYKAIGSSKITGAKVIVAGIWSGVSAGEITYSVEETSGI